MSKSSVCWDPQETLRFATNEASLFICYGAHRLRAVLRAAHSAASVDSCPPFNAIPDRHCQIGVFELEGCCVLSDVLVW